MYNFCFTLQCVSCSSVSLSLTHAHSYHQKHYLRVQPEILNELQLSDEELVLSNSAARLNGYCGGYGTLTEFDNDAPSFKISLSSQEKVKELIAKGPGTDDD